MIGAIITGGYGFSIGLVVTMGYGIGAAAPSMADVTPIGFTYTVPADA